jgi:hypothetical protein
VESFLTFTWLGRSLKRQQLSICRRPGSHIVVFLSCRFLRRDINVVVGKVDASTVASAAVTVDATASAATAIAAAAIELCPCKPGMKFVEVLTNCPGNCFCI